MKYKKLKNSSLPGIACCRKMIEDNHIEYSFNNKQLATIPKSGPIVFVANHAQGLLDGVMLLDLIHKVRPDTKALVNATMSSLTHFSPVTLYVDPNSDPRKQVSIMQRHLRKGYPILIFPAGAISKLQNGEISDTEWKIGFYRLAKNVSAPIVPIYTDGRMSNRHYFLTMFGNVGRLLGLLLALRELFFKSKNLKVNIAIGKPIDIDVFNSINHDAEAIIKIVRSQVYSLKSTFQKKRKNRFSFD